MLQGINEQTAANGRGSRSRERSETLSARPVDSGFFAIALIASRYHIGVDPFQLAHDAALGERRCGTDDLLRAAKRIGLKARSLPNPPATRLMSAPLPAIIRLKEKGFQIVAARLPDGKLRLIDPITRIFDDQELSAISLDWSGEIILLTRRFWGAGINPESFGFRWFLASVWRYRRPLTHVLIASLFVQLFALVTPLFFQIVIDKVLVHKSLSTLAVVVTGLALMGVFDVTLQYLRSYALNHTTSRIDVELGARLFDHLMRLPLAYFESRPTGQTVARMRELETVRGFLTGQGLTSALDLLFATVLVAVLLIYSKGLTLIVLLSIPCYVGIATLIRPFLRERITERFNTGAATQQFLVESIIGVHTLKAAAVEPHLRLQWEDRLAAYIKASFEAVKLGSLGQSLIQFVNKATTALVLLFGARAVIDGDLSVGGLVAFNMIMGQVTAPILRLSQLWQDFQQVQLSTERLADILNASPESQRFDHANLPPARGAITVRNLSFRFTPDALPALNGIDLEIPAGQVVGIVGPSGSGKSTLVKLMQRFYRSEQGQILVDGIDIAQVDVAWLRRQIGVVLQENILFNRTIHENVALAAPGASRAQVIAVARLAGADEFISRLPLGYETQIQERGANLSGGQRQRIAIARALITHPRILIFDEATSSLDYENERIIQANMRQIVQGRTVFIIAHRLAALRLCDRIVTLDGGRIVEDGNHSELVQRTAGFYSQLWRMQTANGDAGR